MYIFLGLNNFHACSPRGVDEAFISVNLRVCLDGGDDDVETKFKANPNIKLVFMTTHAIDEDKYVGAWHDALEGYKARDPVYLNACKEKVTGSVASPSLRCGGCVLCCCPLSPNLRERAIIFPFLSPIVCRWEARTASHRVPT